MELGVLVFSAILVGIIASYMYVKNFKNVRMDIIGETAKNSTESIKNATYNVTNKIASEATNLS